MKKTLIIILLGVVFNSVSCVKEIPAELGISTTELKFAKEGGTQTISFSTNKDWTATSSASWLKVTAAGQSNSASISVTAEPNTDFDERTSTITIYVENLSKSINVKQSTNLGLIISDKQFNISCDAQSLEVKVQSNVDFEYAIDKNCLGWISKADTKALSPSSIIFDIAKNENYESRKGKIVFSQKGGSLSEEVIITQEFSNFLEIEKEQYSSPSEGGTITINYSSNTSVKIEVDASWINVLSTKSIEAYATTIEVAKNMDFSNRTAHVILSCGNVSKTIEIIQSRLSVDNQPNNEIWYTATAKITPAHTEVFGATYSHEKSNFDSKTGFGILSFDGPVTRIGYCAFDYVCKELVSISIPNKVTSIDTGAFAGCENLISITIPQGVTHISTQAFGSCNKLESFFGKFASSDNRAIVIDGRMIAFAPGGLSSYSIVEGVTSIAIGTFSYTYGLKQISFPSSIKEIESRCFEGSGIESISIPATIDRIGESTFYHCHDLKEVNFEGSNLKRIDACAFSYTGISEFRYPEGIEIIGSNVLSACPNLEYVYFPSSIVSIEGGICNSFNISKLEGKWVTDDNKCQIFNNVLTCFAGKDVKSYSIPEGVESTGICFSENPIIEEITLPSTLKSFVQFGFSDCKNLRKVNVPDNVKIIEAYVFTGCSCLEEIYIGKNIEKIYSGALKGCTGLKKIYSASNIPPTISSSDAMQGIPPNCVLYVPKGSEESYRDALIWGAFYPNIVGYEL